MFLQCKLVVKWCSQNAHGLLMGILWQMLSTILYLIFFHINIHMNVQKMIWEKMSHFANQHNYIIQFYHGSQRLENN